jgi:hypothetical protein
MQPSLAVGRDDDVHRASGIELDLPSPDKSQYPGKGTPNDPFIIDWDPADVQNPYNWSKLRKWVITAQVYFTSYASEHCLLIGV